MHDMQPNLTTSSLLQCDLGSPHFITCACRLAPCVAIPLLLALTSNSLDMCTSPVA